MSSDSPLWDVRGWKRLTVHEDPPLVAARNEFLAWLAEVPESHRADLDARLRSQLDHAHLSARLELFIHHYFHSNEWDVQIHPQVADSSNHPDFLVKKEVATLLVECKSLLDQAAVAQQDQRLRQLAENAGKKLGRAVMLHPLSDLPPSIPATRIRQWIERQQIPDDSPGFLEFDFWDDHQGYHYGVRAILLKLDSNGEVLTGVHGLMSQAETIENTQRLRVALKEKASKYGKLDMPYMIAISGETKFRVTTKQEVDALFGDRALNIPRRGPTTIIETRIPNGFFTLYRNNVPRYRDVSAVLVYRFKWLDEDHDHRMHIYHNPNARWPIDPGFFPDVSQFVHEGTTIRWINREPDSR